MDGFVRVVKVGDVKRGQMQLLELGTEYVMLVNVGGELFATQGLCTHAEVPLVGGFLEGEEVECFFHGSRFNVKTGAVLHDPATEPLKRYAVRIEGDDVLVGPAA
ncbi:MAG: non-heme iron oxygenase ferredoxin subunit [Dehalococcoidia bacterium]|nr:non-heme iron oxygenase ferredoxin subunit [Dehalococcoidia bacterium]